MNDILDRVSKVRASGGGRFFIPGNYVVEVVEISRYYSQKDSSKLFFKIEAEVLEFSPTGETKPGEKFSVGERGTWLVDLSHGDTSLSNLKSFVMATHPAITEESVTGEVLRSISDPPNPLQGVKMRLSCVNIVTVKKKQNFTKHIWSLYIQ